MVVKRRERVRELVKEYDLHMTVERYVSDNEMPERDADFRCDICCGSLTFIIL